MPKLFRLLVVLAALSTAFPLARSAAAQRPKDDVVELKDGRVIRGKIIEFFPNDSTFLMRLADGSFVRYNKADIVKMSEANSVRLDKQYDSPKNPALAWVLSFVITGGGQIYNEEVVKGLGLLAIGTAGGLLYLSGASDECVGDECDTQAALGAAIALGAWLGSQIDAPIKASAINRDVRSRTTLSLRPAPHALGVSLVRLDF